MHTFVRAAVFALALTGSAAYAHTVSAPALKSIATAPHCLPVPTCPPGTNGAACGWPQH